MRNRLTGAAVATLVVAAAVAVLYLRPVAQWGSTAAERRDTVAGDALVYDPDLRWTRSITINAPPERVWPWLVQMGVDKGGFYTYDWAEQLAMDPVHNATRIHPEWQSLRVGDPVRPFPKGEPWVVREIGAPHVLVLGGDREAWSWAFELRSAPEGTRLVTRMTSRKRSPVGYLLDIADLVVLPRLLVGVKQRAEGTLPGMPGTHTGDPFPMARLPVQPITAAAWIAALAALAASGRALGLGAWGARRRHPRATVGIAFAAGAAYALTTDTPPIGFVSHTWALALPLGLAAGVLLRRRVVLGRSYAPRRFRARAAVALAEAGTFVVLPATVVWQAATAQGWTTSWLAHAGVGTVAALVSTGVAAYAWRGRERSIIVAALLTAGYVVTGSALVPFLCALALEVARVRSRSVTPVSVTERLTSVL